MKKPERDGIAEILASGRAPGFTVRGGTPRGGMTTYVSPRLDFQGRPISPEERISEDIANMRDKRELYADAKRQRGRSVKGNQRLVGSVPLTHWVGLTKQTGGDVSEAKRIAKEQGFFFEK